jgi:hypothetical protein
VCIDIHKIGLFRSLEVLEEILEFPIDILSNEYATKTSHNQTVLT